MNERIKALRKELHLTQQAFADKLNISKSSVEAYEYRNVNLSERTISDICRIFNVNEVWLRTGEGEMYAPMDKDDEVGLLINELMTIDDESIRLEYYKLIHEADEDLLKTLAGTVKLFLKENDHPTK